MRCLGYGLLGRASVCGNVTVQCSSERCTAVPEPARGYRTLRSSSPGRRYGSARTWSSAGDDAHKATKLGATELAVYFRVLYGGFQRPRAGTVRQDQPAQRHGGTESVGAYRRLASDHEAEAGQDTVSHLASRFDSGRFEVWTINFVDAAQDRAIPSITLLSISVMATESN
jgi:hypothetical protein